MFCLQPDREQEKIIDVNLIRKDARICDHDRWSSEAARSAESCGIREEMTFAGQGARQIQEKEMALSDDRFDIASKE